MFHFINMYLVKRDCLQFLREVQNSPVWVKPSEGFAFLLEWQLSM